MQGFLKKYSSESCKQSTFKTTWNWCFLLKNSASLNTSFLFRVKNSKYLQAGSNCLLQIFYNIGMQGFLKVEKFTNRILQIISLFMNFFVKKITKYFHAGFWDFLNKKFKVFACRVFTTRQIYKISKNRWIKKFLRCLLTGPFLINKKKCYKQGTLNFF